MTIVCHGRFRQFLPAQQLEHSRCAALHSQTACGSAPQVANLVHWQHLRASAVLWRRRWQGLVESIDRSVDRRLRMVVSGLRPSSELRVEWRPCCCAAATPRKCDHIGTSLSMLKPKKLGAVRVKQQQKHGLLDGGQHNNRHDEMDSASTKKPKRDAQRWPCYCVVPSELLARGLCVCVCA